MVKRSAPASDSSYAKARAAAKKQFGYNAVTDKSRRQSPKTTPKHESKVLTNTTRKKVTATAQDQMRNHSLVAWMVRKHLDYVSKFHVSFRTGKTDLDNLVNRIFRWHGAPVNMDVAKRLGRDEMFRFFELEKVVSGDAGLIKLDNLKLQGVESDMLAKGSYPYTDQADTEAAGQTKAEWEKLNDFGLEVDPATGERIMFGVCNRGDGTKVIFDHVEAARNVIFDAYWSRFTSQYRGVSPLTTAINMVQDIHEGFEFNLLKAKMHALFGIAVMRQADGDTNLGGAAGTTSETADASATDDQTELDINPRALNVLDLNREDKIETIESGTPSSEFVEGSYLFIQIAMLALDIPVTMFDSRRSSFSARIADLNEYEVSADSKRTKNRYVRQDYSDWVLEQIWNTPSSPWNLQGIATRNGLNLRQVQEAVQWIAAGSPWLDKLKQVQGDELAMSLDLDNPIDASRRRGVDVFQNIDKTLQVEKYKREQRALVLGETTPAPEESDDE